MTHRPSTFPTDLGIATRAGLTRGLSGTILGSFAEAEMHYRQDRLLAEAVRSKQARSKQARSRQARAANTERAGRSGREVMSRWTTWLPSVPLLHRSSPARPSSSACGN